MRKLSLLIIFMITLLSFAIAGCTNEPILSNTSNDDNNQKPSTTIEKDQSEEEISGVISFSENDINNGIVEDNPIDKIFDEDFKLGTSTVELRFISSKYLDAWKEEFNNVTERIKDEFKYNEDKNRVDEYRKSLSNFVDNASRLEWLNWADIETSPDQNRSFGTGAITGCNMVEAELYKNQTLFLIEKYFYTFDREYNYFFKNDDSSMEEYRNQAREKSIN